MRLEFFSWQQSKMSNIEQGISNVEGKAVTSKFEIPCSIFDILFWFPESNVRT